MSTIASTIRHSSVAVETAPELPSVQYFDALVNLRFDRADAAIAAIERALQLGYPRALLAADPQLETIRRSPRLSDRLAPGRSYARNSVVTFYANPYR